MFARSLVLIGSLALFFGLLAYDLLSFHKEFMPGPKERMPKDTVDLIVVVTGGQGRLKKALELFEEGTGDSLFISGADEGVRLDDILEANGYGHLPGIFRSKILLGKQARSTEENAKEIKLLIDKHDFHSILFLTSSYHLPRASRLLQREFQRWPEMKNVRLYFQAVISPNYDPDDWWRSSTGWNIFLSEYLKSYSLRFGLDTF